MKNIYISPNIRTCHIDGQIICMSLMLDPNKKTSDNKITSADAKGSLEFDF